MGHDVLPAQERAKVSLDFFAAPAGIYRHFSRSDRDMFGLVDEAQPIFQNERARGIILNINDRVAFDLSNYSHVVFVGQRTGVKDVLKFLTGTGVDGVRSSPPGCRSVVSKPFFDAYAQERANAHVPLRRRDLFKGCKTAIAMMPLTARMRTVWDHEEHEVTQRLEAHPTGVQTLVERYLAIVGARYIQDGLTFLSQPLSTISQFGSTKDEFNRGSARLQEGQRDDPYHMNAEFGALFLRKMIDWAQHDMVEKVA